uniref:Probable voltage-dependent anion-selective channel (inferred by orthology to a C. elegans protein) n=1 Tax=Strongyloides venezuelensis TaxID=75913 RepID=A0A0K0FE72_STRVS
MTQPKYRDIGKSASDLVNKGYGIGTFKIKVKSSIAKNKPYEYKTSTTHNFKSQILDYYVNLKCNLPNHNMVLSEKWTPNNTLTTGLELVDYFFKGLTIHLESNYNFMNSNRSASIKTDYISPSYRLQNTINLLGRPILNSTFVVGNKDVIAGVQVTTDLQENKIKAYNVAVSRLYSNSEISFFIKNYTNVCGSFLYKAAPNLDLGGEVSIKQNLDELYYAFATKYCISNDMVIKAKISSDSCVAISVKNKVTPYLSLSGATQFPFYSSSNTSYKIGFGLEYSS